MKDIRKTSAKRKRFSLKIGQVRVSLQLNARSWKLPAHAFVLPIGPRLMFQGQIVDAIAAEHSESGWEAFKSRATKNAPVDPSPHTPFSVPVEDFQYFGASNVIIATAYDDWGGVDPQPCVSETLRLISSHRYRTVVFPLIGAQHFGGIETLRVLFDELQRHRADLKGFKFIVPVVDDYLIEEAVSYSSLYEKKESKEERIISPPDSVDFENDALGAEDCLGVDLEAGIFSRLLMAKKVKMPLAIGLFGKWGSGKSFLMKSIRENSARLLFERRNEPNNPYVSNVLHIEFNAWHYLDADLWASLVGHIYDEILQKCGEGHDVRREVREERSKIAEVAASRKNDAQKKVKETVNQISKLNKELSSEISVKRENVIKDNFADRLFHCSSRLKRFISNKEVLSGVENGEASLREIKSSIGFFEIILPDYLVNRLWKKCVCVCVVAALVYAVWFWMPTHFSEVIDAFEIQLTSSVAIFSSLALWVRQRSSEFNACINLTRNIKREIADSFGDHKKSDAKIQKLSADILALENYLQAAEQELIEAEFAERRALGGGAVLDFIAERKKDPKYTENLGIVSVIRKDFEGLRERLKAWNESKTQNPIERIILYIDDLDRCDPERVVDVLQAVHLLLAFDLFAVIVSVDAKWLRSALHEKYEANMQGNYNGLVDASEMFQASNYLEKIFQIPYQVPAMSSSGRKALVNSLTRRNTDIQNQVPNDKVPIGKIAINAKSYKRAENSTVYEDGRDTVLEDLNDQVIVDQSFDLEEHEMEALEMCCALVSTPRSAKRLVNLYYFLRVQEAMQGEFSVSIMIDPFAQNYRAAILLLALLIEDERVFEEFSHNVKDYDEAEIEEFFRSRVGLVSEADSVEADYFSDLPSSETFSKWFTKVRRFSMNCSH